MKTILVKNVMIQFDTFDDGADQHTVLNTLADINEVLKQRFSDSQPQILMVIEKDKGIDFDITPDEPELPDILGTRKL